MPATPTTWASPRDEFPTSVRALMSLWGGFSPVTTDTDDSLEKRLELDFALPVAPATWAVAELAALLARTAQQTLRSHSVAPDLVGLTFDECMLVINANKLVLSAASSVMLHRVLSPLLQLLTSHEVTVEWASFFRKNTSSPWMQESAVCDVMAQEYADLKAAFPTGQSLLVGPVDGEHFFHFVYDGVDRQAPRTEADTQLNLFLFDVRGCKAEATCGDDTASRQVLRALGNGEYEMLRRHADAPHVSFETNAASAVKMPARVATLLDEFTPARFTLVALQDRHTDTQLLRRAIGGFAGFHLQSSTTNHFGDGYAYLQLVFVRDAR